MQSRHPNPQGGPNPNPAAARIGTNSSGTVPRANGKPWSRSGVKTDSFFKLKSAKLAKDRANFSQNWADANQAWIRCEAHFSVKAPEEFQSHLDSARSFYFRAGEARQNGCDIAFGNRPRRQRKGRAFDLNVHLDSLPLGKFRQSAAEAAFAFKRGQWEVIQQFQTVCPPNGRHESLWNEQRVTQHAERGRLERPADRVLSHQRKINQSIGEPFHRLVGRQV